MNLNLFVICFNGALTVSSHSVVEIKKEWRCTSAPPIRVNVARTNKLTFSSNHQPDATIFHFIILTFIYSLTCFGRFPAHHRELNDCSGSLWFYLRIVVIALLCSWSGRPAPPRTQHDYHRGTKVKPEAATAVIELPMMCGKTPETC